MNDSWAGYAEQHNTPVVVAVLMIPVLSLDSDGQPSFLGRRTGTRLSNNNQDGMEPMSHSLASSFKCRKVMKDAKFVKRKPSYNVLAHCRGVNP